MKKLLLSVLVPVAVQAQTLPSYWQTTEYYRSRTLAPINASSAYARGYTGKGSTIAIIDTGIDTKSSEFQNGKIVLTRDFTGGNNILDSVGHGTHVAGIAAAARNGVGMEGVAFDANLMIAKVTNSTSLSFATVMSAIDWAGTNKAHVANISASMYIPQTVLKASLIAPGVYSTAYTNTAVYPGGMNPAQWASVMKNDIVVVVAAGNEGRPFPNAPAQMATATDKNGNLILGGRMIIAGNWNSQTNTFASSSNGSGTLCNNVVAGQCQDRYKTSDFYLMAPGMGIYSSVPSKLASSGYLNMSGTSMSAPAISGGVAIIHQMWPQMSSGSIVKLLLVTANKNIPGYNPNLMGQGLMDLEKATRPVGNVIVPVKGGPAPISAIMVSSGSAGTGKVANLMVMDDFQRDFYVKSKYLTARASMPEIDIRQASMPYLSRNSYSQFNNYTNYLSNKNGNLEVGIYYNDQYPIIGTTPTMVELSLHKNMQTVDVKFTAGSFTENGKWLGNSFFSESPVASTTAFAGIEMSKTVDDFNFYSSIMHGFTKTNAQSTLVSNLGTVMSYSWNLGVEKKINQTSSFGAMIYQPVTVHKAMADSYLPIGLDSNFNIVNSSRVDLAADTYEKRLGFYYKMVDPKQKSNIVAFVEHRQNFMGQEDVKNNIVGLNLNYKF